MKKKYKLTLKEFKAGIARTAEHRMSAKVFEKGHRKRQDEIEALLDDDTIEIPSEGVVVNEEDPK